MIPDTISDNQWPYYGGYIKVGILGWVYQATTFALTYFKRRELTRRGLVSAVAVKVTALRWVISASGAVAARARQAGATHWGGSGRLGQSFWYQISGETHCFHCWWLILVVS